MRLLRFELILLACLLLIGCAGATIYVPHYPPGNNSDTVKATTIFSAGFEPYRTTNPDTPITGYVATWICSDGTNTNQRFSIDLGSTYTITRVNYTNFWDTSSFVGRGVANFTIYGSNTSGDFADTTYASSGDWSQIQVIDGGGTVISPPFIQHLNADETELRQILLKNTVPYRYYSFKFENTWQGGGARYMGVRRIELQSEAVAPVASFTSANISVATNTTSQGWGGMEPFSIMLTDTSTGSPTSWVYGQSNLTAPAWVVGNTSQNSLLRLPAGNWSLNLTATNAIGSNVSVQMLLVNVSSPYTPIASFATNVSGGQNPLGILITDTSAGLPGFWNMSINDTAMVSTWINSTLSFGAMPYTLNGVGIHNITLYVENKSLSSPVSTYTKDINVNQTLAADFVGAPTTGDLNLLVNFVDFSTGAGLFDWLWTFGDGGTSSLRNPSYIYTTAGTFDVSLTVKGSDGQNTKTSVGYITTTLAPDINPQSTFTFKPDTNIITNTSLYNRTVQMVNITNATYAVGQILFDKDHIRVQHVYANTTSYPDISLVSYSMDNSTGIVNFNVTRPGGFSLGATPTNIIDVEMFYDRYSSGLTSAAWGSGHLINGTNNYSYAVAHLDDDPLEYNWTAHSNFSASATKIPDGATVTFVPNDRNETANSWLWNFGDGNTTSTTNPGISHIYNLSDADPGTIIFYYTVSCTASLVGTPVSNTTTFSSMINVTRPDSYVHADFSGDPTSGSEGVSVLFTDLSTFGNPTSGKTYNWSFGDLGISLTPFSDTVGDVSHVYTNLGTYIVTLTVNNTLGSDTETKTNYIIVSRNQNTQTTFYSPHQVVFQVVDSNYNPIPNTLITANAIESTLPGGLSGALTTLENAFGVPPETAMQMLNSSTQYSGHTDSVGYVVILMLSSIKYEIRVTDTNGIIQTNTTMPQDSYYQIKTFNATTSNIFTSALSSANIITGESVFNTTFTEPNSSYGAMSDYIYDATGKTAGAHCWWQCVDNGTIWWENRTWAYGSGMQKFTKEVPIVPYQQWKWGCTTI